MRTEDVLKGVLEASGSVQYNVAISFLGSAHVKTDTRRQNKIGRGCYHLQRSFELQMEDFDSLKAKIQMKVHVATDSITVTLGRYCWCPERCLRSYSERLTAISQTNKRWIYPMKF